MPDFREQGDRALRRLALRHRQMRADGFDQLLADGVERIERSQRILKDRADAPAADAPQGIRGQIVDALAGQPHFARGDPPRPLQQTDDRHPGERLAGARLAHYTEHFPPLDSEGNVVDGHERSAPSRELDPQTLYFE